MCSSDLWLARASRAPRDPLWIADGVMSDHWAPVSPVSGRLDAFMWTVPVEAIADRRLAEALDANLVTARGRQVQPDEAIPLTSTPDPLVSDDTDAAPETSTGGADGDLRAGAATSGKLSGAAFAMTGKDKVRSGRVDTTKPTAAAEVVFPIIQPPDDPGIDERASEEESRYRL